MTEKERLLRYEKFFAAWDKPIQYTKIAYHPDRTEWDLTITEEESIKEYAITSGVWTDVIYNEDGTFTHILTKEEDIPKLEN